MSGHTKSRRRWADGGRTWIIGGVLLILATVCQTGIGDLIWFAPFGSWSGPVFFAAAGVLYAVGIRKSGSVTGRRSLGTVALIVAGVWTVLTLDQVSRFVADAGDPATRAEQLSAGVVITANNVVLFTAALIAVVEIGRARAVSRPWNWVPAFALGLVAVPWIMRFIAGSSMTPPIDLLLWNYQPPADRLFDLAAGVLLGALSIVLGARARTRQLTASSPRANC